MPATTGPPAGVVGGPATHSTGAGSGFCASAGQAAGACAHVRLSGCVDHGDPLRRATLRPGGYHAVVKPIASD